MKAIKKTKDQSLSEKRFSQSRKRGAIQRRRLCTSAAGIGAGIGGASPSRGREAPRHRTPSWICFFCFLKMTIALLLFF